MALAAAAAALGGGAPAAFAQSPRLLHRDDYEQRLKGMWLGEIIANWTGLQTELRRSSPPFYTDADWPLTFDGVNLRFVTDQDPWLADDDTDIEYVYLHLIDVLGENKLSAEDIGAGWIVHINRFIWLGNATARQLMNRGVLPPATGMATANEHWTKLDAQLTTELFGAIAPGMPLAALDLAETPILTVAAGPAAHAAQFHAALYSLATQVDRSLPGREQAVWLVERAMGYVPAGSKIHDVASFVLADFLANPDAADWERTRDAMYERYQLNAGANGYVYWGRTEAPINFGSGLIALLYGSMDYRETVRIGTLTGWDSDNPTATMGGLLGLILGPDAIAAAFAGEALSDYFDADVTRDNMPDHAPEHPSAEDTLTLMAQRMIPMVEREIVGRGGLVDESTGWWLLPPISGDSLAERNPLTRRWRTSATNLFKFAGMQVTAAASATGAPPTDRGIASPAAFANGLEMNYSGLDPLNSSRRYFSCQGAGLAPGAEVTLQVMYPQPVPVSSIRFVEGDHFVDEVSVGGWFETVTPLVRVAGVWVEPPPGWTRSELLDADIPFQIIDFTFESPVMADGVGVRGAVGGGGPGGAFVTCAEVDALMPQAPLGPAPSWDVDADGRIGVDDLYSWPLLPVDLDGDGLLGPRDALLIEARSRWLETTDMAQIR